MRLTKNQFLKAFAATIVLLAVVRAFFPSIAKPSNKEKKSETQVQDISNDVQSQPRASLQPIDGKLKKLKFFKPDGSPVKNRIISVPNYSKALPDLKEAERRKSELVYVASNPYYYVDKLNNSIPYLVPRAAVLLNDIGRNFFDSLQIKGIPLHKFIVTSVLRSEADVKKLRGHNGNASENSCHRFGTTFDIAYNRYKTVQAPDGPTRRQVRNDTLKWVMSEVLNDLRLNERCYIKYEVKQGCFHITVR